MLEVRNLTSAYGGIVAVRGASLRVAAGQCVALIGSNGAGKTTLLHTHLRRSAAGTREITFRERERSPDNRPTGSRARAFCWCRKAARSWGRSSVRENLELGRLALRRASGRAYANLDSGASSCFRRLAERLEQIGRLAFRRRATDAGDRARPDGRAGSPAAR